jgi:hypothetical protein
MAEQEKVGIFQHLTIAARSIREQQQLPVSLSEAKDDKDR